MESGRQLDDLIEQKIFGMNPGRARMVGQDKDGYTLMEYHYGYPIGHDRARRFSTSGDAALILLDELRKLIPFIKVEVYDDSFVVGARDCRKYIEGEADTLPLAICRFAINPNLVLTPEDNNGTL